MTSEESIRERLERTRARIDSAAARAGRAPSSVRLVAVSKGKPASAIREAYAAGQREFGENYVQELEEKAAELADLDGIVWHSIGQLQRNKVKSVVRIVKLVHAVDRIELATEIDRRAAQAGITIEALIEVNVSGEASKGGCSPGDLGELLQHARAASALRVVGLMTIPPDADDPEAARPFFAELAALRDRHGGVAALPCLSMGMTHDFEIAIAEGASIVRVGTAIFGARAPRAGG